MKKYSEPYIDIYKFDIEDVITTSGGPSVGDDDGEWDN